MCRSLAVSRETASDLCISRRAAKHVRAERCKAGRRVQTWQKGANLAEGCKPGRRVQKVQKVGIPPAPFALHVCVRRVYGPCTAGMNSTVTGASEIAGYLPCCIAVARIENVCSPVRAVVGLTRTMASS